MLPRYPYCKRCDVVVHGLAIKQELYAFVFVEARTFALAKRRCARKRAILYRSKSVSVRLFESFSLLCAKPVLLHLDSTSASSHFFFSAAVPAALGSFSMTIGVSERCASGAE